MFKRSLFSFAGKAILGLALLAGVDATTNTASAQPRLGFPDELSTIAGESFYPGSGGVYNAVVHIYDRGYRNFILTTDRPRAVLSGRVFVQCQGGGSQFVYVQTTRYAGMPAAFFHNPCGAGRAERLDFYLDGYGFKPRGYYTVLGMR